MGGQLLSFFRKQRVPFKEDWSSQELAEFYRVEAALVQAGVQISVDQGVSDEGDPWFVFCRAQDGEVVIHFARIGNEYVIYSDSILSSLRGTDFRLLLVEFSRLSSFPLSIAGKRPTNLSVHPAALLAAAVASALFQMSSAEAVASEFNAHAVENDQGQALKPNESREQLALQERHYAAILAAIIAVSSSDYNHAVQQSGLQLGDATLYSGPFKQDSQRPQVVPELPTAQQMDEGSRRSGAFADPLSNRHGSFDFPEQNWSIEQQTLYFQNQPTLSAVHFDLPSEVLLPPEQISPKQASIRQTFLVDATNFVSEIDWVPTEFDNSSATAVRLPTNDQPPDTSTVSPPNIVPVSSTTPTAPTSGGNHPQASTAATLVVSELNLSNYQLQELRSSSSELSASETISLAIDEVLEGPVSVPAANRSELIDDSASDAPRTILPPAEIVAVAGHITELFTPETNVVLDHFIRETPDLEVVSSGPNIVLLDADESHYSDPDFVIHTWEMDDGSTISIVGISTHLAGEHV